MSFYWLTWSNPVAVWWGFLVTVSAINLTLWLQLRARHGKRVLDPLLLLSAAYVFGCAFRSILPRADVQRICLFDSWLECAGRAIGRHFCRAVLRHSMGDRARRARADRAFRYGEEYRAADRAADRARRMLLLVCGGLDEFPGNVLENSLWTITFALIAVALIRLTASFRSIAQWLIAAVAGGVIGYVVFMATIDVPMYFARWQADLANGKALFGFFAGLHDLATHWVVTHDFAQWQDEIPWMTLYFSVAVWTSLGLGGFALVRHLLPRYRVRRPLLKAARRPLASPVRTS